MKVILVRHADYNLATGNNPEISEKGKVQTTKLAGAIKKFLKDGGIHTIWTSPAARALQTANILAAELCINVELCHEKLWSDNTHTPDFSWLQQMVGEYADIPPLCDVLIIVTHLEYVQQFPAYIGLKENQAAYTCGIVMDWTERGITGEPFKWTFIHWYDGQ
jgi:phosphohistidine phosphatase SixA